jgi:uncharacterized protein YbcC (UPF0753/DUF2309 family)
MANHESVRAILRERGIDIPEGTRFIAALHNTSRDEITYFDPHTLEQHPAPGLAAFQEAMGKALQRNAGERCRWFELGPQAQSNATAHAHVKERSTSIFEPRPEYNHSNNLLRDRRQAGVDAGSVYGQTRFFAFLRPANGCARRHYGEDTLRRYSGLRRH